MNRSAKSCDAHLSKFAQSAHIRGLDRYRTLYRESLDDPAGFWGKKAEEYLTWFEKWNSVLEHDLDAAKISWFSGGKINASYNCIDRHLKERGSKAAFYWEGDEPTECRIISYSELYESVNKFAAVLRSRGVNKGDSVVIHLPMIPELPIAMLACARIGAIHCAVFTGYGKEALADRIRTCGAKVVITSDGAKRSGKIIPIKGRISDSLEKCACVDTVIVVDRCGLNIKLDSAREARWDEVMSDSSLPREVPPTFMDAEDPLFIYYAASGAGKPKGLVHTNGGYLLWNAMAAHLILNLEESDKLWCTEDLGLIAGHSLSLYGALLNGVSSVIFEGSPNYPDGNRYWEIIQKLGVTKFCTGPSTIRFFSSQPAEIKYELSSLEILGSCGQSMTVEDWEWYYHKIGRGRCPIMETWWQSESGGPMMTSLPGVAPIKPGSVSFPFFGVDPVILDLNTGEEAKYPNQEGAFFIRRPWPGMARTIFEDPEDYRDSYYAPFPGLFITSDGATRDEAGYYHMTGRIDDVINVSGKRVGTWEIETAVGSHVAVKEATAVAFPHPIKGEGVYIFVTLNEGYARSDELRKELIEHLVDHVGIMALPDVFQWANALPKTRSGKILRRLLQMIAAGKTDDMGDTTTLADPSVLEPLIRDRTGLVGN